jgi:hypothetical protein
MRLHGKLLLILLTFARSVPAFAESPASPPAAAAEWNARGVQHRMKGQYAQALEAFQQADALARSPKTRAQLGLVEHDLEQYVAAEEHLVEALDATADPWIRKNRKDLEKALKLTKEHLGSVKLVSGEAEAGAMVTIQGKPAGVLPIDRPLRVAKGEVTIAVSAPAHLTWQKRITVATDSTQELRVDLVPDRRSLPDLTPSAAAAPNIKASPPPPDVLGVRVPAPPATPKRSNTWKWSLLGVGAAAVAAGGTYLLVTQRGCGSVECGKSRPASPGVVSVVAGGIGVLVGTGALVFSW